MNTKKILCIFLLLVILLFLIKICSKYDTFESKLVTPKILRVEKEGTNAIVEWYNHNTKIKEYVLLYVDVEKLASGVWVQSKVKCPTKRCKVVIKNLSGDRYKLAVLSRKGEKLSELEPTDIITFTEDKPYEGIAVKPQADTPAEGNNDPLPDLNLQLGVASGNTNTYNPSPSEKNLNKEDSIPSASPSPVPNPQLDCSNGYVKLKDIKTQEDLDKAEMIPKCQDLENLSEYMKKPFYHNWLDKIF